MRATSLVSVTLVMLIALPRIAAGQSTPNQDLPDLAGTWEAPTPDGPQRVVVRPDSTASFGEEIVHWRLLPGIVYIAFGDEWIGYDVVRKGNVLTLSGGDLEEPIDLELIGPPTPRPEGVPVPPAPPFDPGNSG